MAAPKPSHLRLVADPSPPEAAAAGPRLSPEALAALRQLCDLARAAAEDRLLMAGLDLDPTLGGAVRRLAGFRP